MAWAKIDDRFHSHGKVRRSGHEAIGLFVRAMSYVAQEETDGHLEGIWVKEAGGKRADKLAAILVKQGLWEVNGTDYFIHDWLDYNISVEEADEISEKKAKAGKASGLSRREKAAANVGTQS
jgi:hypothetical protein